MGNYEWELMKIDNKEIGFGKPVFIVAEAGINHNGDFEIAKEMVEAASNLGVDAIKFQTIFPDELFSKKMNPDLFEISKKWSFSKNEHKELKKYAKKHGILFFSTPLGRKSAKLLKEVGVPILKIASAEITNYNLIEMVAKMHIPLIISTGMTYISEIASAVEIIRRNNSPFVLLHCNGSYPSPIEDANLVNIRYLKDIFNVPVGYSDHTLGIEACLSAIPLGACVIEKHFTLDKKMAGPDQRLSADVIDFKEMVIKIRKIEKSLGTIRTRPTKSEQKFRKIMKKSIVAVKDIPSGTKISYSMVKGVRPGTGIPISSLNRVVGLRLKENVKKDSMLSWDMF